LISSSGPGQRDALVQTAVGRRGLGDPPGGVGDPVQRLQHPPGDQPAQRDRGGPDHQQRDAALGDERGQRVVAGVLDDALEDDVR
jgi:hypothetical protein